MLPGGHKKLNKILVKLLVVWQLSGLCLTHSTLCDCDIEEKCLLLLCIENDSAERKLSESFRPSSRGAQVNEAANLAGCLAQPSTLSRSAWTMAKV